LPVLQIVDGGALQFAWSGSQTLIVQLAEGEAKYLGRFSFVARVETTVAAMIAAAAWDLGDVWPSYALGFAWGVALTLALLHAPEAPITARDGRDPPGGRGSALARRTSSIPGPRALLCADGDPRGDNHDGDHLSTHCNQWRAELVLRCLLERRRPEICFQ
jgi:dienelactone hydrolase